MPTTGIGADDDSPLPRLAQLAHRLAGAAGTFGFRSIGVAAASLEDAAEAPGRLTGAERNTAVATSASQARRLTELIEAVLNGMKADTAI